MMLPGIASQAVTQICKVILLESKLERGRHNGLRMVLRASKLWFIKVSVFFDKQRQQRRMKEKADRTQIEPHVLEGRLDYMVAV
jgi:hypothetical protein